MDDAEGSTRGPGPGGDGADGAWEALLARGFRAWPAIRVDPAVLLAHAQAVGTGPGPDCRHPEDLYLALAALAGDPVARALVDEALVSGARWAVAQHGASEDVGGDVLQELRSKVFAERPSRLRGFTGRGPLSAWVRVLARRAAIDVLRPTQKAS